MGQLTGAPADSFEVTARRYAALPFARQTVVNRLKAFAMFSVLPFYPGHNLKSYERRMGFSKPDQAMLSIDDERWTLEHQAQMEEQGIDVAARPRGQTSPTVRAPRAFGPRPNPSDQAIPS